MKKVTAIYRASIHLSQLEVEEIKVVKDTPKQLFLEGRRRVNKSFINYPDCVGNCYGYTKEEALENLKRKITQDVKNAKQLLNKQESYLTLLVEYE